MGFPLTKGQVLHCKYRGSVVFDRHDGQVIYIRSGTSLLPHHYQDVGRIIFLEKSHAGMSLEGLLKYKEYAFFHLGEEGMQQAKQNVVSQGVTKQAGQGQTLKSEQPLTYVSKRGNGGRQEEEDYLNYVKGGIDKLLADEQARYETYKENSKSYFTPSEEERQELVYNRQSVVKSVEAMKDLREVKAKPYFARMNFNITEHGKEEYEEIYIGKKAISDGVNHYVHDWRSHIGQTYYMKNQVVFQYDTYQYELLLRRALQIEGGQLLDYYDEYVRKNIKQNNNANQENKANQDNKLNKDNQESHKKDKTHEDKVSNNVATNQSQEVREEAVHTDYVTDPFLIRLLETKRHEEKLTDIIATIQGNQNDIITEDIDCNMIVQGCAGSGKTMILLHRLSYLLFNHKEVDTNRVKIITPNEAFNMNINELSSQLELDNIERLTLEEYYISLLVGYGESEKRYQKLVWQDEQRLDTAFVQHIYSDEFLEKMEMYIKIWYDALIEQVKTGESYSELCEHKLFERDKLFDNLTELNSRILEVFERYRHQIEKIEECQKKELVLRESVDEFNVMREKPTSLKEVEKVIEAIYKSYKDAQLQLDEVRLNKSKPVGFLKRTLSNMGIINDQEATLERKLQALEQKLRQSQEIKKSLEEKCQELHQTIITLEAEQIPEAHIAELKQIQSQLPLTNEAILKQIGRPLLSEIATTCGMSMPKGLYRFKLYMELWILYYFKGAISRDKYIYVDEGQDISCNEYKLMQSLSRNQVVMNIYGDVHQFIYQGRGIKDWKALSGEDAAHTPLDMQFKMAYLKENYRNTTQITQYVNEKVGIKSLPIGVTGPDVTHMTQVDFNMLKVGGSLQLKPGMRSVIIIKDSNSPFYQEILKEMDDIHLVANLEDRMSPAHINVLTVPMAKGLEFETTYVDTEGMNQNEQYIALTRAMNRLIVVGNV